jgi:hypothetical protein
MFHFGNLYLRRINDDMNLLSQKFPMTAQPILHIAQQVFKTTCATLPSLEVFSYNDLQSLSLSAQCRAFIFAELTFSARSLLASLKSSRFNLKHDALREPRLRFAETMVSVATELTREDFIKLLQSALLIEAQYLAQPHKILKDLIFANRTELSPSDVLDRLSSFTEYSYLLDVFKQYLERKQPGTLSAEKFEKVLFEIDSKLCSAYSHEEFMMLFNPLFEFYQRASEKAVECETLRLFLSEKNLADHLKRIDLALQNGIQSLTAEALNDLLLAPLDILAPKPELPQSDITKSDITKSELTNPKSEIQLPQSTIQTQLSEITKSEIPPIDFFELEKQRLQSQKVQQEPTRRDVRLLISDEERKQFIKRLFKGSEEDYNAAISAINQMKTWREASLYIDREVFSRFKVDEFSSEAVAFVDIVFERFQNR